MIIHIACISPFSCLGFFTFLHFVLIPSVAPELTPLVFSRTLPLCFYLICIVTLFEAPFPVCLFQKNPDPDFIPFIRTSAYILSWNASIFASMSSSFVAGAVLSHSHAWHCAWHKALCTLELSILPSASGVSCDAGVQDSSKRAGSQPPANGPQVCPKQGL